VPPLKIFIYAQDTLGLGHVQRCTTLARALLERRPDAAVLLASKSAWPATVSLGERFDFLKLPTQLTLRASSDADRAAERSAIRAMRRDLLRDAVVHLRPKVLIVDNEPLGYGGEMAAAIAAAEDGARVVFGMRDVMDDPQRIAEQWEALDVIRALEERFDRILIYGHPDVFDTLATYGLPASVTAKARYSGYLCSPRDDLDAASLGARLGVDSEPLLLVTGGGGQDALPLFSGALQALPLLAADPTPQTLLVTGPFMPAEDRARVEALADTRVCRIRETVDVVQALVRARAAATMGGYNTLVEAMMVGRCPIVVPRATHKREQLIRAQAFEARGLARCLPPSELSATRMAEALDAELAAPTTVDGSEYLDRHAARAAELVLEVLDS
jgi:predicted glycosyltransferase